VALVMGIAAASLLYPLLPRRRHLQTQGSGKGLHARKILHAALSASKTKASFYHPKVLVLLL